MIIMIINVSGNSNGQCWQVRYHSGAHVIHLRLNNSTRLMRFPLEISLSQTHLGPEVRPGGRVLPSDHAFSHAK